MFEVLGSVLVNTYAALEFFFLNKEKLTVI